LQHKFSAAQSDHINPVHPDLAPEPSQIEEQNIKQQTDDGVGSAVFMRALDFYHLKYLPSKNLGSDPMSYLREFYKSVERFKAYTSPHTESGRLKRYLIFLLMGILPGAR
jgi:hypothetical protein